MDYKAIGKTLRSVRRGRGYTQEALAERANIGGNFLGKIERGQSVPSLETLVNLANALDVSADVLLQPVLRCTARKAPHDVDAILAEMRPEVRAEYVDLARILAQYYAQK